MNEFLNEEGFYMNPKTGTVDTAFKWEMDFFDYLEDEGILNDLWEKWGGNSLIEVERIGSEWIEK